MRNKGFTIVELLIVIVVIGILAAITIVAYNGIQTRAQDTKINADIATIVRAVTAARNNEQKTLTAITGSAATGSQCWAQANDTDLATLSRTTPGTCWPNYASALDKISIASGINIRGMVDPFGRPYLIDENEGESGTCGIDTVAVYKRPFTTGFGVYALTPSQNVPRSGYSGCAPS